MYRAIILISTFLLLGACSTVGSTTSKNHKHIQTVYFAINNLEDGGVITWSDNPTNTHGSVKILATQSYGGKTCRMVNSDIRHPYRIRNYTQCACTLDQGRTWQFHSN